MKPKAKNPTANQVDDQAIQQWIIATCIQILATPEDWPVDFERRIDRDSWICLGVVQNTAEGRDAWLLQSSIVNDLDNSEASMNLSTGTEENILLFLQREIAKGCPTVQATMKHLYTGS